MSQFVTNALAALVGALFAGAIRAKRIHAHKDFP